ncbi:MAG: HAD hydrolase-like protein [Dehalococcoidia bacterium]|nr:HAD hydrolase-like protein [Dehalococcoidia bacterium]
MTAVLWDMDDTLLNTLPGRMKALAYAHEACLGWKTDPEALWRSHRGGSLEDMGRRLLPDDYMRFVNTYREHYYNLPREIDPYPGVVAVLEAFQQAEIPMAVVTSKIAWGATEELTSTGLLQYFHSVVGADDTDDHKPDPAPVYEALDRLPHRGVAARRLRWRQPGRRLGGEERRSDLRRRALGHARCRTPARCKPPSHRQDPRRSARGFRK